MSIHPTGAPQGLDASASNAHTLYMKKEEREHVAERVGLRDDLEKVIRSTYSSADDAERAAQAASVLAAYLRADEIAERVLTGVPDSSIADADKSYASLTLNEAAERVLEDAGVPLHVKELGKRVKARGWRHRRPVSRPDQINYQLAARLPRHPDVFIRVAPNTFALVRWGEGRSKGAPVAPKVGLFRGPGGAVGASLGELSKEVAESAWRSS